MESPVHVFMLFIQAVRGLPRLRACGIVLVAGKASELADSAAAETVTRE